MDQNQNFTCPRCDKNFKTHQGLQRHIGNKKPCILVVAANANDNNCMYCKRVYSTKFNLIKHQKICKMKNGGIANIPDPNERLAEQLRIMNEEKEKEKEEQKKDREKLIAEVAELREMMKEMLLRPQANNAGAVNSGTINIGTQNNIVINNYNTPNVDHLLEFETFRKMFSRADIDLPVEIALNIYFDPSHPENASVHLIDKETKHVLAKVNGQWNTFTMEKIVDELRDLGYKYAAEGIRMHLGDNAYPDRQNYIKGKVEVFARFKHQKISPKSREYELGMIEEKMFDEFTTSSQHPVVIADKERRKQAIMQAKRGEIL